MEKDDDDRIGDMKRTQEKRERDNHNICRGAPSSTNEWSDR